MDHPTRHSPDHFMSMSDRQGYNTSASTRAEPAKSRAGKTTFSGFGHKLVTFFRETWRSILVLCIMGGVTGGVWSAKNTYERLFPITFFSNSGDIVWTQFAYPYREPIFNSLVQALICIIIPIVVILFAQVWLRSFCDAANGILGLAFSLVTGTCFQVIIKKTIGGLRPHFLSVCEPVIPDFKGVGYNNIMFTIEDVCTGDKNKIQNAIQSFPSGHSEIAFAGFFYLSIWLFTHLKIQSRYRPGYWRMVACVLPILFATYLSCALVLTYNHHGYDVIFGVLIGVLTAIFGYRMAYKSLWNKRLNAIPSCHASHEDERVLPK